MIMQKQFLPIGLDFAKKDLRAAFLLSFLINTSDYYTQNDKDADGWFYCTADNLKERIGFTRADIQHAVTVLCAMNLLQTQKRGMPAKIYYRVNTDVAIYTNACLLENDKQVCTKTTNKFAENQQTSLHENDKQVCINPANKFVEIQQTSLSENDSNKELIYKELNNKNKKQEPKEEEDANFSNSLPTPKVSVSKKSKNWFSAEKVQEIVFGLIQRFYPNQQKGWGDLLNEYFNNVKSAKTKIKKEASFLKNVSQDAERLLEHCSAAQIQDSAIIAYLDLAEENAWQSLTKWTGEKGENYKTKLKSFELAIQNDAQSGEWNMQDARFANPAYFNYFMEYIYKKYTLGSIRKTRDNQVSQKQQFAVLVSKLSTDLKTFGSDLKDVAARLEKEVRDYNNPHTKPKNGFSKQPKDFDFWLNNKEWEKVELKAPKTAPTTPQTPKAEPIYQIPEKAQISENKQPLPTPVSVPISVSTAGEYFPQWLPEIAYVFFIQDLTTKTRTKAGGLLPTLIAEGVNSGSSFLEWIKSNIKGYPEDCEFVDSKLLALWDKLETQIRKAKTA
jgi:DNA-binding transcriptional regulator GbsR (MarR family)